jgi:hypothetical protein
MLEPVPMASRALTSRSSVVISGHQWSSEVTSAHLALACSASFEAVEHEHVPAMHSDALRCTQRHSEALRCTIRSTRVHNQMSSAVVISWGHHQRSSDVISAHQCL